MTIAVQAAEAEPEALAAWVKESGVPFAVGAIRQDIVERKYAWSIRSLPWLILTDEQHIVRAEGFTIDELDQHIRSLGKGI